MASRLQSVLLSGLGANLLLTSYVVYGQTRLFSIVGKQQESLDFGMDRIDECLNRIDLRNNEYVAVAVSISGTC